MDVFDTRLANLRWLIFHHYQGRQIRLARTLGKTPGAISRLFTEDPKQRRAIGHPLARAIEHATGYPDGWLDVPHFEPPDPTHVPEKPRVQGNVISPWGYRWVPMFDYVQAWKWTERADPYPITATTEIIWTIGKNLSDRAFGLVIEDEGMQDTFHPGDIVIIDPVVLPKPGDFVVAKITQDPTVIFAKYRPRGVDKDGHPVIELALLNDDYPTVIMDTMHPGRVIGTMFLHYHFRQRDRGFVSLRRPMAGSDLDLDPTRKDTGETRRDQNGGKRG